MNKINRKILFLASILILLTFSCSSIPYYDNEEIADNLYEIGYQGNKYSTKGLILKLTYRKAAKTALNNGYNYFYIVDTEKIKDHSSETSSFKIEEGQAALINTDCLIGCNFPDSINYSLPAWMITDEQKYLYIKIFLVSERIDNAPYPFDAELIIEEFSVSELNKDVREDENFQEANRDIKKIIIPVTIIFSIVAIPVMILMFKTLIDMGVLEYK